MDDREHLFQSLVLNLGGFGVFVFFSLSGFLISKLLLDEVHSNGRIDLPSFYIRRTLRIWPVYYAAIAVGFFVMLFGGASLIKALGYVPDGHTGTIFASYCLFLVNWVRPAVPTTLKVLWSISVEEQFYIFFPLTLTVLGRAPKYPVVRPALLALAICWVTRAGFARYGVQAIDMYNNTFVLADHLLYGALLAQLLRARPRWILDRVRRLRSFASLGMVALAMTLVALDWWTAVGLDAFVFYAASALASTGVVCAFALGDGRVHRAFSTKWARFFGDLTYRGYVFHMYGLLVAWVVCNRLFPKLDSWSRAGFVPPSPWPSRTRSPTEANSCSSSRFFA